MTAARDMEAVRRMAEVLASPPALDDIAGITAQATILEVGVAAADRLRLAYLDDPAVAGVIDYSVVARAKAQDALDARYDDEALA